MSVTRHVWTAGFGQAKIYTEAANGTPTPSTPVIEHCYVETVQFSTSTDIAKRAVTGRGRRKIIPISGSYDDVQISIAHLAFKKSTEFDLINIFNPHQQLRFEYELSDIFYDGVTLENDAYIASFARALSYSVNSSDNEEIDISVLLEAEILT